MYPRSMALLAVVCVMWGLWANAEQATIPAERPSETVTLMDRSSHHHHAAPTFKGFWRKRYTWRPRWVKTWQTKKVYVPLWKRVWGPVQVKEWVPVPKPPPGWAPPSLGPMLVKQIPHH